MELVFLYSCHAVVMACFAAWVALMWSDAMTDEQEPGFNPNVHPVASDGRPLCPGDYEVRSGGQVQLATVFEDDECDLLVRFAGSDRTQRVDECASGLSWQRITPSEKSGL